MTLQSLLAQFTLEAIIANLIIAGMTSLLLRYVLKKAWNAMPKDEKWYWLTVTPLIFTVILFGAAIVNPRPKPIIVPKIDTVHSFLIPNSENVFGVILTVSIRNLGLPTILEDFQMTAKLPSGRQITGVNVYIPDELRLPSKTLYGRDAIYNKAVDKPIETGGMIRGIFYTSLQGQGIVDFQNFNQKETTIELKFHDAFATEYKVTGLLQELAPPSRYYPGLSKPY